MVLFVLSGHNKEEFQVQAIESDNNHTEIVNSVQGMINLTGEIAISQKNGGGGGPSFLEEAHPFLKDDDHQVFSLDYLVLPRLKKL